MILSAKLIKESRTAAGLTQADLARRAGTSQPTIAAYEAGDKIPRVATLERLLEATGASLTVSRQGDGLLRCRSRRRHASGPIPPRSGSPSSGALGTPGRGRRPGHLGRPAGARPEHDPRTGDPDLIGERKDARSLDAILADIEEAGEAAREIIERGKQAWEADRLLKLAGEAVIGRIADAANRLPDRVKTAVPDVSWDDIRDIRILVDRIYHRIDYEALWTTLERDVPHLLERLRRWTEIE